MSGCCAVGAAQINCEGLAEIGTVLQKQDPKTYHTKGDPPMKKTLYLRLIYALLALASLIAAGASSVNWG